MRRIALVLLGYLTLTIVDAQDGHYHWRALYHLDYRLDSTQSSKSKSSFILLFNQDSSYYRNGARYILDSLESTQLKNSTSGEKMPYLLRYSSFFKETVLYSNKDQLVDLYQRMDIGHGEILPYYEEKVAIKWQLLPEKKTVNGYNCQEASCDIFGRHWTAWFAVDYPFPYGPYKFHGLPGLIVQLQDDKKDYVFNLYSFSPFDKILPLFHAVKMEKVSKSKFLELYNEYNYGVGVFSSGGARQEDGFLEMAQRQRNEKKTHENNLIELKPFSY